MKNDKPRLHECPNPAIRCFVFKCRLPAKYFIGRSDGPKNMVLPVCEGCADFIVDSIVNDYPEMVEARLKEIKEREELEKDLANPQAGEYPCPICGEVFITPQKMGAHKKICQKGGVINGMDS